jgi:GNAT superfamily N-acetyltransferase
MPDPSAAITLRPATPEDANAITRVYLESAEHHARIDPDRFYVPSFESISERYRQRRQHPPDSGEAATTLVAELAGEIVGFVDARLMRSPDPMHRRMVYCHIVEVAVSPRCQSQGIGARLVQAAEDWGRDQGADLALLEYLAANPRAAALYQRLGYAVASMTAIKRL